MHSRQKLYKYIIQMYDQRILTGQSDQEKVQNDREVRGDRFENQSWIAELWMSVQELRSLSAPQ